MAKQSEMNKIVRECKKQGLTYHGKQQNGHHLLSNKAKILDKDGNVPRGKLVLVSIPCTPRRDDAVRNSIARLRRELDFVWKGH